MEKNKNFRMSAAKLLTDEQNDKILYDLLREKDFSRFCMCLKNGYRLDAFLLNCMLNNNFEKNIPTVLGLCSRFDASVYDFLVLYWGKEKAEAFLAKQCRTELLREKFDDVSLVMYEQWELLAERGRYDLLIANNQFQQLEKAMKHCLYSVCEALLKTEQFDFLYQTGHADELKKSAAGRKELWKRRDWVLILSLPKEQILKASGMTDTDKAYAYVAAHDGQEALYAYLRETEGFLLRKGFFEPFIYHKDWEFLYDNKCYRQVNVEDWWLSAEKIPVLRKKAADCAARQKNWDFLEEKGCPAPLFRRLHWCRWYRALAVKLCL